MATDNLFVYEQIEMNKQYLCLNMSLYSHKTI